MGPIAAMFNKWVDEVGPSVPPTSALGKAIPYSVNHRPKLNRYFIQPRIATGPHSPTCVLSTEAGQKSIGNSFLG